MILKKALFRLIPFLLLSHIAHKADKISVSIRAIRQLYREMYAANR